MKEKGDIMRNRGKGILVGILVLCMSCMMPACAFAEGLLQINSATNTYENPHDLHIQVPDLNYSTTAAQISIYGASDYDYPVYMNNNQIKTTDFGFFAEYVDLNIGTNTFIFTNNNKTKTVTITRTKSSSGGSSGSSDSNVNIWGSNVSPKYGKITGSNISRMVSPGTDDKQLLMPLAKGTVVQLTGEAGNLYRLYDGTFVYKSNVETINGTLPQTIVTGANFMSTTGNNCTELQLQMDQNALYNLELSSDYAILTVYHATSNITLPEITPNKIIQNIQMISDGSIDGKVIYALNFKNQAPMNGYYVEFESGYMKVGFKHLPILNGTDLTGARIHIDAGHGGTEPGASGAAGGFGLREKDINLSVALSAQKYLESKGATVIMTRTDDTAVALTSRAALIASEKPDFCLSIHCNSMPVTADYNKTSGLLTFYSFDHLQAATAINDVITNDIGMKKSAPRHSNLAMTRMTGYPAVLIETAFMSNPSDYEWLIGKETQEQYGLAVGHAIESYLKQESVLNDVIITIDGKILETQQPPIIKNDHTLVPLRAIFEALGANVTWEGTTQTVIAEKDGTVIKLQVNGTQMEITEGSKHNIVNLDVAAQLINDWTMVPARAVSEALNATVDWDQDARTVMITT